MACAWCSSCSVTALVVTVAMCIGSDVVQMHHNCYVQYLESLALEHALQHSYEGWLWPQSHEETLVSELGTCLTHQALYRTIY